MKRIFADFQIVKLQKDPGAPGLCMKARKPFDFKPVDLSQMELYSVILGRRSKNIPEITDMPFMRKTKLKISAFLEKIRAKIGSVKRWMLDIE